ncbi:hypothetical protein HD554DRAFT_2001206, partial [Boletus coccyginus]
MSESNSLFQNSFYVGNTFNGILYGVELVLYIKTIQSLRADPKHTRTNHFFAIFSTALLFFITIFVAVQAVFGQEMWIANAGFEGGSAGYLATYASVWYQTMGTTASIILQLMSDALLIYRCFVVYNSFLVLIFPSVLWTATLIFGILELYTSGVPSGDFFVGLAAHIGVTYAAISIGLNVLVSAMICARIAYLGVGMHSTRHTARGKEMMRYAGTIPIIVESALPYAVAGISFLVSYGMGSGISILFMSIYVMFTCISPQMIIIRIADGKAWQRCT